jgi:hypothetical protein
VFRDAGGISCRLDVAPLPGCPGPSGRTVGNAAIGCSLVRSPSIDGRAVWQAGSPCSPCYPACDQHVVPVPPLLVIIRAVSSVAVFLFTVPAVNMGDCSAARLSTIKSLRSAARFRRWRPVAVACATSTCTSECSSGRFHKGSAWQWQWQWQHYGSMLWSKMNIYAISLCQHSDALDK